MTGPEDVVRGVCEMRAGSDVDGQHLQGIECRGREASYRAWSPTVRVVNSHGPPNEMNAPCDLCYFLLFFHSVPLGPSSPELFPLLEVYRKHLAGSSNSHTKSTW